MENLIENAQRIIELNREVKNLESICKNVSDADICRKFDLKFSVSKGADNYTLYIYDRELVEFIKTCVHEHYNKKLEKLKEELNQYVISKKI